MVPKVLLDKILPEAQCNRIVENITDLSPTTKFYGNSGVIIIESKERKVELVMWATKDGFGRVKLTVNVIG